MEKLYEIKTGETIKSVKPDALADEWAKIARRREPNARYAAQCQSTLNRFAAFVRQENPKVLEITQVTRTLARAFMDAETKRGVTGKTWNDTLKLLRATFRYLLAGGWHQSVCRHADARDGNGVPRAVHAGRIGRNQ